MKLINKRVNMNMEIFILVAVVSLFVYPIQSDYFSFPKLVLLGFFLALYISKTYKGLFSLLSIQDKILICYLILIVISTLNSVSVYHSIWGSYAREEGLLALVFYILFYFISKNNFKLDFLTVKYYLYLVSIVAIIAVFQYFNLDILKVIYPKILINSKITSTIGNRNFLGSYLVLFFPLSVWYYIFNGQIKFICISGLLYLTLLMTLTRGAWLGALFSVVLMSVYVLKKKKSKIYISNMFKIFCLFFIITIIFEYNTSIVFGRFISIGKDLAAVFTTNNSFSTESGFQRIFLWQKTLELIRQKPFLGWGPDTLGLIFNKIFSNDLTIIGMNGVFDKAHNEYLQIAYASGIPALLTYLIFLFSVLRKAWFSLNKNSVTVPIFCSVVGYLVQAIFNISVVSVAYIFWIFLGALMYLSNEKQIANEQLTNDA